MHAAARWYCKWVEYHFKMNFDTFLTIILMNFEMAKNNSRSMEGQMVTVYITYTCHIWAFSLDTNSTVLPKCCTKFWVKRIK